MSCSLLTAITFAEAAHDGQLRADGSPFLDHPLSVLDILWGASIDLPLESSIVAVLHDVLEDTPATEGDLLLLAGENVARAVEILTRPLHPDGCGRTEAEVRYLRRMFLASERFPYLPLVKLADRVHNVETAVAIGEGRMLSLSDETCSLYLPLFSGYTPAEAPYRDAYTILLTRLEHSCGILRGIPQRKAISPILAHCGNVPALVS